MIEPPLPIQLPIELWLEIVGNVRDIATLSMLMRVNRTFHDEAERHLYLNVTLDHSAILHFCKSVSSSPRRAKLVECLHLPSIDDKIMVGGASRLFLSTLNSLRNLEYLTLCFSEGPFFCGPIFQAVFDMRFPFLRGFSTNHVMSSFQIGLTFFQEHPSLEELEIGVTSHPASEEWADGLAHFKPCSLRTITCRTWFLHDRFLVPPTLTHYHATCLDLDPEDLLRIARLLGNQLVSLRISEMFTGILGSQPPNLMLDELAKLFPRLRFLQLDMDLIVNCIAGRPRPIGTSTVRRVPRDVQLTLAWVYTTHFQIHEVNMKVAAAWHEFLDKTALEVLRDWGDYVERIVYRYTVMPYVSVSLSEDGTRLVSKQDPEMVDDQWKLI
ncbi:hypothetical protein LXA43DRAFT_906417 [Ganoderma leucocontextum]|nr:hypothetical protein LXA43DRAFT_906417 [Ganoderma leucocontextum]